MLVKNVPYRVDEVNVSARLRFNVTPTTTKRTDDQDPHRRRVRPPGQQRHRSPSAATTSRGADHPPRVGPCRRARAGSLMYPDRPGRRSGLLAFRSRRRPRCATWATTPAAPRLGPCRRVRGRLRPELVPGSVPYQAPLPSATTRRAVMTRVTPAAVRAPRISRPARLAACRTSSSV